ncbi:MAG: RagB/SusD family nutrient uptake outer membrane protein [Marinifilaceae bacterium]
MKKTIYTLLFSAALIFGGCDSFLDVEPQQKIPAEDAYNKVSDAKAALNGLYNLLGQNEFAGTDVIAIGDFAADMSKADGSSGHFVAVNDYTVAEYTAEVEDVWEYGYSIISGATSLLMNIDELVAKYPTEVDEIILYQAQAYGIRAYAYFLLVNLYGLPYGTDSNPHGGLVLMDEEPIPTETTVSRSSVKETYALILKDIKASMTAFSKTSGSLDQFYMNVAAVNALASRVSLFMGDFKGARDYAVEALSIRGVTELSATQYVSMWQSTALTNEDIFTIAKTTDDNLSANSLNTLYGSYGGALTASLISDFAETDIRLGLINTDNNHPKKFDGIPSSAATSNVPQFRVSEMKLNIAEAEANLDHLDEARKALLFTAKRNTAIKVEADLPAEKSDLLAFIAKERKREFFCEGHRWFNARRTGELINVKNDKVTGYDVAKFVYPIPADEINSGYGCEQNEGWSNALP